MVLAMMSAICDANAFHINKGLIIVFKNYQRAYKQSAFNKNLIIKGKTSTSPLYSFISRGIQLAHIHSPKNRSAISLQQHRYNFN